MIRSTTYFSIQKLALIWGRGKGAVFNDTMRIVLALNASTILPLVCPGLSFRPCVLCVQYLYFVYWLSLALIFVLVSRRGGGRKEILLTSFYHSSKTVTFKMPVSSENSGIVGLPCRLLLYIPVTLCIYYNYLYFLHAHYEAGLYMFKCN